MSVKVTLEFTNVDEAIVALGRLATSGKVRKVAAAGASAGPADLAPAAPAVEAAPPAAKPPRKPRSDRGQAREPYGPRNTEAKGAGTSVPAGVTTTEAASAPSVAANAAAPQAVPAPAAPKVETPAATKEQAQVALEKLFNTKGVGVARDVLSRFGVQRLKDLPPDRYGELVQRVEAVVAGTEQP